MFEVNSSLVGSMMKCPSCGIKTMYGASGRPPVKHNTAPPKDEIMKEAKEKVKKNEERGITDTKIGQ